MDHQKLPPLNWLRAFEASARHLSFTNAAQELNMTQSAVSQQIKSLEGFLSKPLFYRHVRRLELTEAGKLYLPWVQDSFRVLEQGTGAVIGPARKKTLQIVSNLAFTVHFLTPRLPDFHRRYPDIRLNFTTPIWHHDHTSSIADLEIRFDRHPADTTQCETLFSPRYFPVAKPGTDVQLETLFDHPLYDCAGLTCGWESWLAQRQMALPKTAHLTWASTYVVSFAAAMAGSGLAIGHDILVADLVREGRLMLPFDDLEPMTEAYYLIHPSGQVASPEAGIFADWLKEQIEGLQLL